MCSANLLGREFPDREIAWRNGAVLLVRAVRASDTSAWVAHVRSDLDHLGEHLGWPASTADAAGAQEFITRYAERAAGRVLLLGAFDGQRLMGGTVLMGYQAETRAVELGCWAVTEIEGYGVMRRMCTETLRYARNVLEAHRIEWRTAAGNNRSVALARRLGFSLEGRLRQAGLHHERWQDLDLLSLVGSEIDNLLSGAAAST